MAISAPVPSDSPMRPRPSARRQAGVVETSPPSPVFGGRRTAIGCAGGGGGGGGTAVPGTAVGADWLQVTVTVVVPLVEPAVTVTVAVPLWFCGAVRTERTPPPWSTALVGDRVPRLVV